MNINNVTENKMYWNTVKSLLSDKVTHKEVINLAEDRKMLGNANNVAETFNIYFCNIACDMSSKCHSSLLLEPSVIIEDTVKLQLLS